MQDNIDTQTTISLPGYEAPTPEQYQNLRKIFGEKAGIKVPEEDGRWRVTGTLEDGVTKGGQKFVCKVSNVIIALSPDQTQEYRAWLVTDLIVDNVDISSAMNAPVYFGIPDVQQPPIEQLTTETNLFEYFAKDNDFYANMTSPAIYGLTGFTKSDHLVSLFHESNHFTTSGEYNKVQSEKIDKYRLLLDEFKQQLQLDDFESMTDDQKWEHFDRAAVSMRQVARDNNTYDDIVEGARLVFEDEVKVNKLTAQYFKELSESGQLFDEDSMVRLSKFLTTLSLTYSNTINRILGPGTTDPRLAEIS